MKTLTLHNLDPQLSEYIQKQAAAQGQSLNKTAQKLLAQAAGLTKDSVAKRRKAFAQFCGLWTEKERKEFDKRVEASEEQIYPEDWA